MGVFIPGNDGRWVSEDFARLQEIFQDFNTSKNCDIELRWVPPDERSTNEEVRNPYCVFDKRTNSPVFFASELDSPEEILAKLIDIDNTNGDVYSRLEAHNNAVKIFELKKRVESFEEANDEAAFLIGSPLNYVKHKTKTGEIVKLDDQRRRIK